jgi:hypothetical protein
VYDRIVNEGHTRFERFLLSVFGPASIGDPNAPYVLPPDPARDLCPRCTQPWDDHTVERPDGRTLARCPQQ